MCICMYICIICIEYVYIYIYIYIYMVLALDVPGKLSLEHVLAISYVYMWVYNICIYIYIYIYRPEVHSRYYAVWVCTYVRKVRLKDASRLPTSTYRKRIYVYMRIVVYKDECPGYGYTIITWGIYIRLHIIV